MAFEHHGIEPVCDKHSSRLILGSFPSVKSREQQFFYGHPQNRFWKVLAAVFQSGVPVTIEEKKRFLLARHIALWDVIAGCDIQGSSDSSIKDIIPNDLNRILSIAPIRQIYTNGSVSAKLYDRYCFPATGIKAVKLPSTSPANAACSLDRLIESWSCIKENQTIIT